MNYEAIQSVTDHERKDIRVVTVRVTGTIRCPASYPECTGFMYVLGIALPNGGLHRVFSNSRTERVVVVMTMMIMM